MKKFSVFAIAIAFLIITFTGACATVSSQGLPAGMLLPADVKVIPPGPEIPKELAVWSGMWVGVWSGAMDSVLVVEEVGITSAKTIYAFGTAPQWGITRPEWYRVQGELANDTLKLKLPNGRTVTYRMVEANELKATYEGPDRDIRSTTRMTRVR
ncbi:MAG: hypothetical protein UX23_C0016G0001 [Parcubacteria group bacterium GW2011_GWB1_45_9]|nr:MAG: hypothetical protein UX23_C0016G0001 [Parcubacteria group bacterium GW2011_GWB1_45_9]